MRVMTRTIAKIAGLACLVGVMFVPSANAADSQFRVRVGVGQRAPIAQRYVAQPGYAYRYQRVYERGHLAWINGRRVWVPGHWVNVPVRRYTRGAYPYRNGNQFVFEGRFGR